MEHPHAARRLRAMFPAVYWIETGPRDDIPVVRLEVDAGRPEGSFALDVAHDTGAPAVTIRVAHSPA